MSAPLTLFVILLIQSIFLWALKKALQRGSNRAEEDEQPDNEIRLEPRRTFKRFVRYFIAWPLGALVGLLCIALAINAFDEDLTPQAKALAIAPPNPYRPEENLYIALLGIEAPPGVTPIAYAQLKLAKYDNDLRAATPPNQPDADATNTVPPALPFKGNIDFCNPFDGSIWAASKLHKAEIEGLLADNTDLYRRHAAAHALSGFHDPTAVSMYAPAFPLFMPIKIHNLYLADFAMKMQSRNPAVQQRALDDIGKDIAMYRHMLTQSNALIWKMVAGSYLQADYLVLADMYADRSLSLARFSATLDRIAQPFDLTNWKIGESFSTNFRMSLPLWTALDNGFGYWKFTDDNWLTRLPNRFASIFFKRHATENLNAEKWARFIKMADTDPAQLDAAHEVYDLWEQKTFSFGASYVYNPVGKMMLSIERESTQNSLYDYTLRTYDIAAFQRMAKLAWEIRKQQISRNDIPAFMQQHPEWATHPVDRQKFSWNAEKGEVTMKPLGQWKGNRRLGMAVW